MFITLIILEAAATFVNNQLTYLMEEISRAKENAHFIRVIDKIMDLSQIYDGDDLVDTLCYIIISTDDWDIKLHALTAISKIKGK
jgi:hypothetical protein